VLNDSKKVWLLQGRMLSALLIAVESVLALGAAQEWWWSSGWSLCFTCVETIVVVIASAMNNIICWVVQPYQRCSPGWQHKVFDQRICCDGSHRQTNFIAGAMVLLRCRSCPNCPLWQGACCCLVRGKRPYHVVARGSSLPSSTNAASLVY
jgi:hypothetical protein